jgi:hypothetical protein
MACILLVGPCLFLVVVVAVVFPILVSFQHLCLLQGNTTGSFQQSSFAFHTTIDHNDRGIIDMGRAAAVLDRCQVMHRTMMGFLLPSFASLLFLPTHSAQAMTTDPKTKIALPAVGEIDIARRKHLRPHPLPLPQEA